MVVKESRAVAEGLARIEPPTEGLVPGMTVDVEIVVAEAPNALQVPADAVFTAGGASYVYLVDDAHVRQTPVTTGLSSISATEISSGLAEGALVVIGPATGLSDGTRVQVQSGPERS